MQQSLRRVLNHSLWRLNLFFSPIVFLEIMQSEIGLYNGGIGLYSGDIGLYNGGIGLYNRGIVM